MLLFADGPCTVVWGWPKRCCLKPAQALLFEAVWMQHGSELGLVCDAMFV